MGRGSRYGAARDWSVGWQLTLVADARKHSGVHERIARVANALPIVAGSDTCDGNTRELAADD